VSIDGEVTVRESQRYVFVGIFLLVAGCAESTSTSDDVTSAPDSNVPGDTSQPTPDGTTPSLDSVKPPGKKDVQLPGKSVLNVFYVIHLHLSDDRLPYDSKLMKDSDLNADKADNMVSIVNSIKGVADKHGLKIGWQPTIGPAKGFCAHHRSNHIFKQLLADGHEVGIHAHKVADLQPTYDYLRNDCGLAENEITNASGYQVFLGDRTGAGRAAYFSEIVQTISGWNIHVGTSNIAPESDGSHEMAPLCTEQWGDNTDSWKTTDNLLYPWKPDVESEVPCAHNPAGVFVMVDHSGPEWTITDAGKANVLSGTEFNQLKVHFDAALDAVAGGTDGHVAAWGFVTHISEYTTNNKGQTTAHQGALDALDAFLSYVDTKRDEGLAVYSSPAAIAKSAYPEVF
jgi:hypothetical protein